MFQAALLLFIVALISALLGFGGLAGDAADMAKLIFFVLLGLSASGFAVSLVRDSEWPS